MSTRQNPQARVQRSPNTINVAVPSLQHSERLGQPASSHTVTNWRSLNVRLIPKTSAPICTLGRSHSGLRSKSETPPSTPASARRANMRTGAPGPSPREKRDKSSGLNIQATSCKSASPSPQRSIAKRLTIFATSCVETLIPSSLRDVTGYSLTPQGTMC